ncbi:MAG: hypothetical protein ACR2M4_06905 [Actinomycetota bacterium]
MSSPKRFEDNGIHLGDEAMIRSVRHSGGRRGGKTCILGAKQAHPWAWRAALQAPTEAR